MMMPRKNVRTHDFIANSNKVRKNKMRIKVMHMSPLVPYQRFDA